MERKRDCNTSSGANPRKILKLSNSLTTNCHTYDKQFPFFRAPQELGSFSRDGERRFHNDRRQLKVYVCPKDSKRCNFDLRHGYDKMIQKDPDVVELINGLLRWIMHNKKCFHLPQKLKHESGPGRPTQQTLQVPKQLFKSLNTDFICWRGLLTRLLCVPYENKDDLLLGVIRFRGTCFLCEFETEAKKNREKEMTEHQVEMCAWGWKFEQYVTADREFGIPETDVPVNNNEEFGSVVRSRLNSHSLVFSGEVDCADPNNSHKYIELKTSRLIETRRQHENFCKYKLIKWWAQSFLIGIPKIVCGFRDDDGMVKKLEEFPVTDIPKQATSVLKYPWKPNVCFNFLDMFLELVKSTVTEDNERRVFMFRWQPGCDMVCEKKSEDADHQFLPDWFTQWDAWDKPV